MKHWVSGTGGLRRAGPVLAVCVLTVVLMASQSQAILIDHFTDGFFTLVVDDCTTTVGIGTTDSDSQTGLAVIGGRRDVTLTLDVANPAHAQGTAEVADVTPDHYLSYSNDAGVESVLLLEYPILTNSGATVDMIAANCFSLQIEFLISDLGSAITFQVDDGGGGSDSVTKNAIAGPNTFVFGFNEFVGVDFSDVAYISLMIDGVSEGDYRIDSLECGVVPEPMTMLGLFLGLGGVGAYIRKRRMA